jgi:hypothetical protein
MDLLMFLLVWAAMLWTVVGGVALANPRHFNASLRAQAEQAPNAEYFGHDEGDRNRQ